MQFSPADQASILAAVGDPVDIVLHGVVIRSVLAFTAYEEITDSPNQAEIGTAMLTMKLAAADYAVMDKASRYTFNLSIGSHQQRGPALRDGSGMIKLQLTKA